MVPQTETNSSHEIMLFTKKKYTTQKKIIVLENIVA